MLFGLPLAAAGVARWTYSPRIERLDYIRSVTREAEAHLVRCRQAASDPKKNGFIAPIFLGLWSDSVPNTPLTKELVRQCGCLRGIFAQPEALPWPPASEDRTHLWLEFRNLLPRIHPELRKPVFLPRQVSFESSDLDLNFIMTRHLVQALTTEAEVLSAEGDSAGALQCLRSALAISGGYRAFPLMIRMICSVGFAEVACQTVLHIYSPQDATAPWSELATAIFEALPDRSDFILSLKCELAFAQRLFDNVRRGSQSLTLLAESEKELPFWKFLPGYVERERRKFLRAFAEFLAYIEKGEDASHLRNKVADKFRLYFDGLELRLDFFQTVGHICRGLADLHQGRTPNFRKLPATAKYCDGQVILEIPEKTLDLQIKSSSWARRQGRFVVFELACS